MRNLNYLLNQSNKVTEKVLEEFNKQSSEKEFDLHDGVIIGLFEDTLAKIHSLKTLLDAENSDSIDVILRSVFEGYVYLTFILDTDSERRAKAYAYKNKLEEFKLFQTMREKSRIGREIRDFMNLTIEEINASNPHVTDEEIIMQQEKYMGFYEPNELKKHWYDFDNKTKSFEQLCSKLKLEVQYNLIYRMFSKDVHSNRALSRIKVSPNMIKIGNFDGNVKLHISLSSLLLLNMIRDIYKYYNMKKELQLFNINIRVNHNMK